MANARQAALSSTIGPEGGKKYITLEDDQAAYKAYLGQHYATWGSDGSGEDVPYGYEPPASFNQWLVGYDTDDKGTSVSPKVTFTQALGIRASKRGYLIVPKGYDASVKWMKLEPGTKIDVDPNGWFKAPTDWETSGDSGTYYGPGSYVNIVSGNLLGKDSTPGSHRQGEQPGGSGTPDWLKAVGVVWPAAVWAGAGYGLLGGAAAAGGTTGAGGGGASSQTALTTGAGGGLGGGGLGIAPVGSGLTYGGGGGAAGAGGAGAGALGPPLSSGLTYGGGATAVGAAGVGGAGATAGAGGGTPAAGGASAAGKGTGALSTVGKSAARSTFLNVLKSALSGGGGGAGTGTAATGPQGAGSSGSGGGGYGQMPESAYAKLLAQLRSNNMFPVMLAQLKARALQNQIYGGLHA